MRQVFIEKQAITVKDVCQPLLDDNLVLVSVYYSCISSGTESATLASATKSLFFANIPQKIAKVLESVAANGIDGTKALIKGRLSGTIQPLGYSCSGRVIAVGKKIKHIRTGDFVACAGAGFANHADVICVPENLVVKISDEKFLEHASITTIGAIALQGIRRAQPQLGEIICVLGLGLLGQITVQLAKHSGCTVLGIDLLPERLELATQLGADAVFNASSETLLKDIAFYTNHQGVDATLITAASQSNAIAQQAMELTRKKGKVVLVGDVGLGLERAPFYQKEIDFLISCSYGPGRYDSTYEKEGNDYPYAYVRWTENRNMQAFVDLIQKNQITIAPLISEVVPVEHAATAFAQLQDKKKLGMVLSYLPKDDAQFIPQPIAQKESTYTFIPARADALRVGMIGAGGFAKMKLMPLIASIKNTSFTAIIDSDIANSTNVSRLYGSAQALTDDQELFNNDLADVVIIASPHKYHCDQIMRALDHNKAVFVEKPMVTTFEQLERLTPILNKSTIPVCVDYNRSFAPFVQSIKTEVIKRSSPLVAHYRMNAGFIPKDHWVQTDVGAGRIIGEACHIFDLFCYLTDAKPLSVSVEVLRPGAENLFATDNFSAQIAFSDGSLCTLLYTALGHNGAGKERMELYFDSKTIVMDDYKTLQGFGLPASFNKTVTTQDKGHEFLLNAFFTSLQAKDSKPVMSRDHLYTVAHLTLVIDQLARNGGGEQQL
jgi:predicted dehydrogenase/threonine dehydrogenase-like Zn-dependent dehydrogenase